MMDIMDFPCIVKPETESNNACISMQLNGESSIYPGYLSKIKPEKLLLCTHLYYVLSGTMYFSE